jgi:lipid II:glycine glycyltransferase (peptidoglycan interpeptide bridge formation enzyme)
MMKFIFTKEKAWLVKWDNFVSNNPKGSHLIHSDWLKSYKSYGFDFEIGLVLDNNQIVGGYGVVIPKFLLFKFYIIPHGPIYDDNHNLYLEAHVSQIKRRAKAIGACYLQLSMPISSNAKIANYVYQKEVVNSLINHLKRGKEFSYVYASYGINWVDLKGFENSELFLEQLTPKVRRNIRMPYNKEAVVSFATDIDTIEKGYNVIIENAKQGNYNVRAFSEFKSTIVDLVAKKQAYFMICEVADDIRAAGFFVRNAGYITNITGGVLREKPDIKLGYMLQWEMIKKSFELGLQGYNISMGGSSGVQDFKTKFGAEIIYFEDAHYHYILKPLPYKLFKIFNTYLKPYKAQVSKLLARFK